MAEGTLIEWARHPITGLGATWNIVTGCDVVSPGCTNCYAMKLAGTRLRNHPSRHGLTIQTKAGPVWNGEVRFNQQWLTQPLAWKKPHGIFVAAHGDLFAEGVTDGQIMQIFNVMVQCPQHIFYVLTKRPERMRSFFCRWGNTTGEDFSEFFGARGPTEVRGKHPSRRGQLFAAMLESMGEPPAGAAYPLFDWMGGMLHWPETFRHIWLGVSIEDQKRADERHDAMFDLSLMHGWTTFVSYEPALGPVDWADWSFVDWMISGGESGPRPSHPDWHRATRDYCAKVGIPYFFKQWGNWREAASDLRDANGDHIEIDPDSYEAEEIFDGRTDKLITADGRLFTPANLPPDTPARLVENVGKKAAGRELDGRTHDEFPELVR